MTTRNYHQRQTSSQLNADMAPAMGGVTLRRVSRWIWMTSFYACVKANRNRKYSTERSTTDFRRFGLKLDYCNSVPQHELMSIGVIYGGTSTPHFLDWGVPYPHFSGRKGEEFSVICCQQRRSAAIKLQLNRVRDPAGKAHDALPDPIVGWEGGYFLAA